MFTKSGATAPKLSASALVVVAFIIATLCSTSVAFAQNNPLPIAEVSTQKMEKVEVVGARPGYAPPANNSAATKTDTPILLTPQSVQIIPRAVLNDQKVLTLTDAIRNVAGTGADFGFNGGGQALLMLRGFQMTSMTAAGSMSGSGSFYLNGTKVQGVPVNMSNVESVEVVKGPSSVLYGRAEPGGIINIVTRQLQPHKAFVIEQMIGEYGLSRTQIEANVPLNEERTVLSRASASWYRTDSNRDFVRDQLGAFNGTVGWVPNAKTRITLALDYSDQKYRNDYGVPAFGNRPADLPWNRQFNDSPELSGSKTFSAVLDAKHEFSNQWSIKARALSLESKTREVDVTPYRVNLNDFSDCLETRNQLCRYYYYVRPDGKYRLDQFTLDLAGKITLAGFSHQLLFGVDTYRSYKEGTTYLQQLPSVDINNPVLGNTPRLDTATALPLDTVDRTQWTSVYVQDQIALGAGVHLVGALRYDRTRAVFASPGTPLNEQSFTSPRVGVVWEFKTGQSIYGQYQDSVAANNGRNPVSGLALAAERARQFEIGYKIMALDGMLNSTVAAYQLTKRNRADYSLFPIVQSVGAARSRGLEWDVIGQVNERLSLIASYAYTDAVVTEDPIFKNTRLANVARHSGSMWARFMIDAQWAFGAGTFGQGQRQGDQGNTFQLPGYARVDAMTSYSFNWGATRASVQLNVNNIFNRRYYTGSHQFVKDWIAPGAPRTVLASVRFEL
jgi:iron complex outermembrane recepter protein